MSDGIVFVSDTASTAALGTTGLCGQLCFSTHTLTHAATKKSVQCAEHRPGFGQVLTAGPTTMFDPCCDLGVIGE